jgi:hypothetical protein
MLKTNVSSSRRNYGVFVLLIIPKAILLLIVLSLFIRPVTSFASWLECNVDLTDPTEVIMNMRLQHYDSITYELYKKVEIEYQYEGTTQWIPASASSSSSTTSKQQLTLLYPPNVLSTLKLRLKVPEELISRGGHQIQYVMDLTSINGCNEKTSFKEYGACLTTKFSNPQMCQGKRSHSTDYLTPVTLTIDDTNNSNTKNNSNKECFLCLERLSTMIGYTTKRLEHTDIVITAAWAAGREAVKVTQPLILHRASDSDNLARNIFVDEL